MKIVLMGDKKSDKFMWIRYPDGLEFLNETVTIPALKKAKYTGFSDFGFAWGVFASIVASLSSAYSSSRGGSGGITSGMGEGWSEVQQYLVKNKFLYCTDDCGKAWRVWINNAGQAEIAEKKLTGANPRFECYLLPTVLLNLVPCAKTKERAQQYRNPGSGGSYGQGSLTSGSGYPTAGSSNWMIYALLAGIGLLLVVTTMSAKK